MSNLHAGLPVMALHPLAHQRSDSCNRNHPEKDISEKLAANRSLSKVVAGDDPISGDDWISPTDMALLNKLKDESPGATYHHIKRLPSGTKPVRLVGEGAANAVFEIKVPRGNEFKGLLLRVAKVPKLGQVTKYDYLFQQQFFQTAILPILGEYAVHQELVILQKSGIVEELNALLQHINHERKSKFQDSYVGLTGWGLLVEDMRPQHDVTLVEFKPKWLSQSPSAPKSAIRCRQCALELRYLITKPSSDRPLPTKKPCPLTIANADAPPDIASPLRVAPRLASESAAMRDAISKTLNHPILQELRIQQELHDPVGPLNAKASDACFAIAMTIRDCTCFAQIARNPSLGDEPRKIRFGDLDWKDPNVKFDHWHGTEAALIDGGFYTAESILCDGKLYRPPTICLLERTSTTKTDSIISVDDQSDIKGNVIYHKTDAAALRERLDEHEKTT